MKSLAEFTHFIRDKHLKEYAVEELKLLLTKDIPLMKLFSYLTQEQLLDQTVASLDKFLFGFEKGTAFEDAAMSLRQWEADELPGIPKAAIHPTDLVLIYYVQKASLLKFLPLFTSNPVEIIEIIIELEDYYSKVQDNSLKLLFKIQKEVEEEVRKREVQLNEAQKIAQIGSYEWEIESKKTNCSKQLYEIFGLPPETENITSKDLSGPLVDEDRPKVLEAINEALTTLNPYECEYMLKMANGTFKTVQAKGKVITGEDGKPVKLVGTIQDITEQKKSQNDLIVKTQELQRSNEDLQRFASVASHDLKEPLRKIHTYADMLATAIMGTSNEYAKNYSDRILTSCARMENAIEDLLTYSRVGAEKEKMVQVDLTNLINTITDDYEVIIKQKHAQIVLQNLPVITAASSEMRQLFQNLISNALKFNKPDVNPVITISAAIEGKYHRISIHDNGIGFEEKYTSQIFEVFRRLHSKDEYEGSGIGLSICKKIIEKHKGIIEVHSKPNEGTTFIVLLPISNQ
jgi:PAS domain S-box-containing protein